jgi:hypothetical protein
MKIQFERSGGFSGIPIVAAIDSQSLPTDEAQHLRKLVQEANFFDLPPHLPASGRAGVDQFQFKITIEDGERTHTVETTDSAAAADLQPLLRQLTLFARRR